jgi:hypothetical protein
MVAEWIDSSRPFRLDLRQWTSETDQPTRPATGSHKPPGALGPQARTFGRLRVSGSAHQGKGGPKPYSSRNMMRFCEKDGCRLGSRNRAETAHHGAGLRRGPCERCQESSLIDGRWDNHAPLDSRTSNVACRAAVLGSILRVVGPLQPLRYSPLRHVTQRDVRSLEWSPTHARYLLPVIPPVTPCGDRIRAMSTHGPRSREAHAHST